jgi:hypothetical protein
MQAGQSIGPLTIGNPVRSGWAKWNESPQRLKPCLLQPLTHGLKPVPFKSQSFSGARKGAVSALIPLERLASANVCQIKVREKRDKRYKSPFMCRHAE